MSLLSKVINIWREVAELKQLSESFVYGIRVLENDVAAIKDYMECLDSHIKSLEDNRAEPNNCACEGIPRESELGVPVINVLDAARIADCRVCGFCQYKYPARGRTRGACSHTECDECDEFELHHSNMRYRQVPCNFSLEKGLRKP